MNFASKSETVKERPTTANLQRLAFSHGFDGVPGLAKKINRSRVTVWRAVRWPDQFGPTYELIQQAFYGRKN